MAWSGGAFTRIGGSTHWVDDKNAAINIVASRHDTNDEDLASGINFCLNKDGTSKPTADFLPNTDNTQALGSASFRWATINGGGAPADTASGTFTATLTGCATAPTGTATWTRVGKLVTIALPALTATSNANTMTYTGLPAALQPLTLTHFAPVAIHADSGGNITGNCAALLAPASGTITFYRNGGINGWTNTGSKGLPSINAITYLLA